MAVLEFEAEGVGLEGERLCLLEEVVVLVFEGG